MLRVIETHYDGYHFRSRLEARWAVFFRTLGISYEYEKEGYDLGDLGWYLPDFWLPEQKCWVEIKGQEPSENEQRKCHRLSSGTGRRVYLFFGPIPKMISALGPEYAESVSAYMMDSDGWDLHYGWCECPTCGLLGIQFDARADRLTCTHKSNHGDKGYNGNSPRLLAAYEAARAARFEH